MADTTPFVPESPTVKWRRRMIWSLVVMAAILIGAMGVDFYRGWRYQHLLAYAATSAANKDWEGVEFSLRQAMQIQPGTIEPYTLLADYAESLEPDQAVYWRRVIAQQQPGYLRHRLKWAETAMARGDVAEAARALQGIDRASLNTEQVQTMLAKIAAAAGDIAAATKAASEAVRLDPANVTNRFMLARFQLADTNEAAVATAKAQIEAAATMPAFTLEANRVLGMEALRRNDAKTARIRLEAALKHPDAGLADQLRYLDLLRLEESPELSAQLLVAQSRVGTNVASAVAVAQWMTSRGLGGQTVAWIKGLPASVSTHPMMRAARLEGYLGARQGTECVQWLGSEDWGSDDQLRLALLARVHFGMRQTNECDAVWQKAVAKGSETPRGRRALWQVAAEAGWKEKALDVLEMSAKAPTDRQWALTLLFDHFSRIPDTTNMLRVSRELLAVAPEDTMVRNNVAALSLLLKQDVDEGFNLARRAWTERSKDPAVLATYGFGLYLKGRAAEALEVFERIPQQYAGHPSIAVYYAAVLVANGQTKKAQPYIKAASAGHILPEEKILLGETIKQTTLFSQ